MARAEGTDTGGGPSVFTRILDGEIPGEIVLRTDRAFVLRDIAPQAPVHLLVVPVTSEYRDVVELAVGDPELLAHLVDVARTAAHQEGTDEFRLVFNTGAAAGQTVFHVHAHVLAGELDEQRTASGHGEHRGAEHGHGEHRADGGTTTPPDGQDR